PACDRPMLAESHAGLRLDVCRDCKGVWFDHHELAEIWKESFDSSLRSRGRERGAAVAVGGDVAGEVLLNSLFFAPDLLFYGAHAAGRAALASAELAANLPGAVGAAPELAVAAVEAAGEAAGSVFEVVVNIIAGICDGLYPARRGAAGPPEAHTGPVPRRAPSLPRRNRVRSYSPPRPDEVAGRNLLSYSRFGLGATANRPCRRRWFGFTPAFLTHRVSPSTP